MASPELEAALLRAVDAGALADSGEFAAAQGVDHQAVVGLLKSLLAAEMITMQVRPVCRGGSGGPARLLVSGGGACHGVRRRSGSVRREPPPACGRAAGRA